jgi:site-specific DNA recombinase
MKITDLYIRVSTDEQADKGYSQRNQDETLRRYCDINGLKIRKVIYEDHSAKTFNRPEWNKYLADLKKNRNKADLVLFTKWDRFSRNAGDAYQMISTLRRLGVEPQGVEQPLDLSIPENKMMLAFYLAAPEVENDRRALNVFFGMRRAKKEGRYMGTAPMGYINKTNENNEKYITLKEPDASIMKWAFKEVADGVYAADQVRKQAAQKGLKCSRMSFWLALRNPVYCGKIKICSFKDEEETIVEGQHEPLISEKLFYDVQEILSGRKRKTRPCGTRITGHNMLPLRGFLICPKCGRMLTGSGSKGRYSIYYYYHCIASCGCRFGASTTNESFVTDLKKFIPHPGVSEVFVNLINDTFQNFNKQLNSNKKQILIQLEEINKRLKNAREMFADQKMDSDDYKTIKSECTIKINELEMKLTASPEKEKNIDILLNKAVGHLSDVDVLYDQADIDDKRKIISSIYPENLVFDGEAYRTNRLNEAVRLIYKLGESFNEIKKRKEPDYLALSREVVPAGIEPASKV